MADRHVGSGQTYTTIQSAVNASVAGDNILIHAGDYSEGQILLYDKHGTSSSWITIQPYGADIVNIEGDTVPNTWGFSTIMIRKCDYIHITRLNIFDSAAWGVTMWNNGEASGSETSNIKIDYCYIYNSAGMAIHPTPEGVGTVHHITVEHNIIDLANTNWSWTGTGYIIGYAGEAISISNVQYFEVAYNIVSRCGKECIDTKSGSTHGSVHHNTVDTSTWAGEPGYNGENSGIPNGIPYGHIGIYCDSFTRHNDDIKIYNNRVYGNHGAGVVVGVEQPTGELSNIDAYNNIIDVTWESAYGMGIFTWSGQAQPISNIHFYNNSVKTTAHSALLVGAKAGSLSNVVIENNIFTSESTFAIARFDYYNYTDSTIILRNNLYHTYNGQTSICWLFRVAEANYTTNGPWWGTNYIRQDPLFTNRANGDFHILSNSPAINTGANISLAFDYDDHSRPVGICDIGAYEYGSVSSVDDTVLFTIIIQ